MIPNQDTLKAQPPQYQCGLIGGIARQNLSNIIIVANSRCLLSQYQYITFRHTSTSGGATKDPDESGTLKAQPPQYQQT